MQRTSHNPLKPLEEANSAEAHEWLFRNSPLHFDAVQVAVDSGVTPDEIYRFILRDTYRPEIAHRCRLAARHMITEKEQG